MQQRTWVIDRIEDGIWAVLTGAKGTSELVVPKEWLPDAAREGHVIEVDSQGEGIVAFRVDEDATGAAIERARELRASIRKGPAGDIDL